MSQKVALHSEVKYAETYASEENKVRSEVVFEFEYSAKINESIFQYRINKEFSLR